MPNLTIKNLPREVHENLRRRAVEHRRSLNQEILEILCRESGRAPLDAKAFLKDLHAMHRRLGIRPLTEGVLEEAREGRP
jgi:plasmid stability protein